VTKYFGDNSGLEMTVFEAAMKYKAANVGTVVFAGKLFGNGSSRDWAAKGQMLLNVKAVMAESFERIHRSNLIGMGILPVEIKSRVIEDNGLTGAESFALETLDDNLEPYQTITIVATKVDGSTVKVPARILLQTPIEIEYYRNGGILQFTLRQLAREAAVV